MSLAAVARAVARMVAMAPPPSAHLGLFWQKKNHHMFSSRHQPPKHLTHEFVRLPSNEMTLMRMVAMVAIRPIWLLWPAKL
jgi:hypothetical protein